MYGSRVLVVARRLESCESVQVTGQGLAGRHSQRHTEEDVA